MRGVYGSFVCGQHHLVRQRDRRHKITASIERLEIKHLTVLLTLEVLSAVYIMMDVDYDVKTEETINLVQRAENDSTDDSQIALIAYMRSVN